ncbi:MAG TPA: PilZ domain-containing protein [Nitrospiraceae bacterium]
MTVRYSGRRPIQGTVGIETNGRTAQGRVLNLSVPGCLLETGIRLCVGQAIALTMLLSDGQAMNVGLAVVRWIAGYRAGMEFIRMSTEDQTYLRLACGWY